MFLKTTKHTGGIITPNAPMTTMTGLQLITLTHNPIHVMIRLFDSLYVV